MAKTCSAKLMLSSVACCRVQPTRKRMGMDNPASYNFPIWPPKAGFLKASSIVVYHPATYAREAKLLPFEMNQILWLRQLRPTNPLSTPWSGQEQHEW